MKPPHYELCYGAGHFASFMKECRGLESNQLALAYEANERPVLFPGIENDPPAGFAPASPRYRRGASLPTLWRNFEIGRAPRCCPECLADPNGADCCLPRARDTSCPLLKWTRTPDLHR